MWALLRTSAAGRGSGFRRTVCNGGIVLLYYSKGEIKFPPHLEHLHNINHLVVPKGIAQVLVHGWATDCLKEVLGPHFSCIHFYY